MLCIRNGRKRGISWLFNLVPRVLYSRRSDRSTSISLHKVVKSNGDSLDGDIDNSAWDTNSNWKLLTPRGFRFYLPGSVGPAWLDAKTTAQVKTYFDEPSNEEEFIESLNDKNEYQRNKDNWKVMQPILDYVAQECPVLLRKSIEELFPECLDVTSSQLTIITIRQKANLNSMRWRKEAETEKLAKYFVLAAWNICTKLKMAGYWADFINPFSGQPHLSSRKSVNLYETDERFRCIGFKVKQRNNCKIITFDNSLQNFIGSLYTTAPPNTELLEQIINDGDEDQ
ncbi:methylmalonic aciduria and homocystinuria type D homolog, mitochondrial-like isoform X2 [Formica exsecta]|uniref:methylmalonic aciduria and homocystinuria type D homolog, mitochondrial-like isoform X1 n=1 Tax=Formica exsecta TaxID=72781 RepID=UPI0011419C2F|nr:methylmalonic aciduria and homocystinuria type D homolog, mitochondrial-like isoform X1 [Formica exsecta]XP_029672436.1 methylmalonic aciduria and homocystinuria type D homolog, mitochondrial-like isoform X2 [Formica exsecta]